VPIKSCSLRKRTVATSAGSRLTFAPHSRTPDASSVAVLDQDGNAAGTAFAVPILASSVAGTYVLTASHVLPSRAKEGDHIALLTPEAEVVASRVAVRSSPDDGLDAALLHTESPIPILRCADVLGAADVVVRGCAAGAETRWANFEGRLVGRELASESDLLDLQMEAVGALSAGRAVLPDGYSTSPDFLALRGLSGGPICTSTTSLAVAIGHVVRRARGFEHRMYGTPIGTTARFLGEEGFYLPYERPRAKSMDALGRRLVGELFSGAIEDAGRERRLWDLISGSFYEGLPLDALLEDMTARPGAYGLSDQLTCAFVQYFAGRFAIKRGDAEQGLALLADIRRRDELAGNLAYERLRATIGLREAAERATAHPAGVSIGTFLRARDHLANLSSIDDSYYAYEAASCEGRVATRLLQLRVLENAPEARNAAQQLADDQAVLIAEFPEVLLDKQEVVELAVAALLELSAPSGSLDSERLAELAERGQRAAVQRGNNIFLAQMTLLSAAAMWSAGNWTDAMERAAVAGAVFSHLGISPTHEGVGDMLPYLARRSPQVEQALAVGWGRPTRDGLAVAHEPKGLDAAEWARDALRLLEPADVVRGPW